MKRIAVVSDTHLPRSRRALPAALDALTAERPSLILHCGDFTKLSAVDALEAVAPVDGVAGNNDGSEIVARFERRKIVTIAGARIGMVHGDGVWRTTLHRARAAFAGEPVAAILFGHSHIPYCVWERDRWLLNPGSLTDKRRQPRYSFAVLDIKAGTIAPRLVFFDAPLTDARERATTGR